MAFQEQELAQARENSTSAVSIYSPGNSQTAIIKSINLCNTTTSPVTFRIFKDNDGTTYDETTARYYDHPLAGKTTMEICMFWPMNNPDGNLAFQNSVANAITISVDGAIIS